MFTFLLVRDAHPAICVRFIGGQCPPYDLCSLFLVRGAHPTNPIFGFMIALPRQAMSGKYQ